MDDEYNKERQQSMEEHIKKSYRQDEDMMILVFAQWCLNQQLDPFQLYQQAYPQQSHNEQLTRVMELTVDQDEAGDIADDTVLGVLSLFGNDDLAYVVTEAISRRP
ncbi:hypothetical protein [Paenibacillus sp. CMAA1364]